MQLSIMINDFKRLETRTEIDQSQYMMLERELTSDLHGIRSLYWNPTIWEHRTRNLGQIPFNSLRADKPTHLASSSFKRVRLLKFHTYLRKPRYKAHVGYAAEHRTTLTIFLPSTSSGLVLVHVERGGRNEKHLPKKSLLFPIISRLWLLIFQQDTRTSLGIIVNDAFWLLRKPERRLRVTFE